MGGVESNKQQAGIGMVARVCNHSIREAKAGIDHEFNAGLNPVSKNNNNFLKSSTM